MSYQLADSHDVDLILNHSGYTCVPRLCGVMIGTPKWLHALIKLDRHEL